MKDVPPSLPAPAHPFGTTMRIDLSPEALEGAKRGPTRPKSVRRPPSVSSPLSPHGTPAAVGGVDFQQLLQNVYDAVLITELEGQVVQANLRAQQFFHAELGELARFNILSLISGADETLLPTIFETLRNNRFVLLQATCARMDGSLFPVEISVNQLKLGGETRLSFFIRDVTVRKEQQDRLRAGYTALQNSSSAIAITGRDAALEYGNPAFFAIVGLAPEAALETRSLREFVGNDSQIDEVLEAVRQGRTWSGEMEMRRVDGSNFFAHASVTANLDADGDQVGSVFSLLDITPQKQAQQQLEAYARALREKNAQMQGDLDVAGELHQAMLPDDFEFFPPGAGPENARLHFRHLYCPCGTIGGDFFDLRPVSDHEVAFLISDVMGHGIRSALVVATIRGLMEELRPLATDPGALLTQLNSTYAAIFNRMGSDVTFATAFYGVMDTRTGLLRFANASHPKPFLLQRSTGGIDRVSPSGESSPAALGLFDATQYATSERTLVPGDTLLLYTDGLSEAENATGELYEARRLPQAIESVREIPLSDTLDRLLADAREFISPCVFDDDICLLAMQFKGAPASVEA
ncbi:MAG: SpoIIE family protein phosphatase [Chthoniobacteraceae bacterium]